MAPPTLRIRNLQDHISSARTWLQHVKDSGVQVPGLDLDDCLRKLDFTLPEGELPSPSPSTPVADHAGPWVIQAKHGNMLTGCDRLMTSKSGQTHFYGAFSDVSFLLRTIEILRKTPPASQEEEFHTLSGFFNNPLPPSALSGPDSRLDELPGDATERLDTILSMPNLLLSFLTVQQLGEVLAEIQTRGRATSDHSLALFHLALALGHAVDFRRHQEAGCSSSTELSMRHFQLGMSLLLPIQMDSLTALEALMCAISFLLYTARLPTAHSLISTAWSLAVRLGLFTQDVGCVGCGEAEKRRRTRLLCAVAAVDMLASIILDLPPCVKENAIPESRLREWATEAELKSDLRTSAMLRQVFLLSVPNRIRNRTQREVGDEKLSGVTSSQLLQMAHDEFRQWKRENLAFLASLGSTPEHSVIKKDLEMVYSLCQIMVFRSHLHHLRSVLAGGSMSKTLSYPALVCLKVATSTIDHAREESDGSWLTIYTIYSAAMCLVFLVAADPGTTEPRVAWQTACRGVRILTMCRCGNNLSSACLEAVRMVATTLSRTIYVDFEGIENSCVRECEQSPSHEAKKSGDFMGVENRKLVQAEAMSAEYDLRDIMLLSDSE